MRKIESQMLAALANRKNFSLANTRVEMQNDGVRGSVFLHNNHIADVVLANGRVLVNTETLARWQTPTTKSRLRALGANVTTRKGVTYLDNVAI